MESKVLEYIRKQKSPQKEILAEVRQIFLRTIPGCREKIGWGVITFEEDKFYLAAMKDRVHIGFSIKGLSQEEIRLFEGKGKTMRHIKITRTEDTDEKKIAGLIRLVQHKAFCDTCHKSEKL